MSTITSEIVIEFVKYITNSVGATVKNKTDSSFMKATSIGLGIIGTINPQVFLNEYATTIGRTIYIPFQVGVATNDCSLWEQCLCITHECQHVIQLNRVGYLSFISQYLTNTAARTFFEVEGYSTEIELNYWQCGEIWNIAQILMYLESYSLKPEDLLVAKSILTTRVLSIQNGAPAVLDASRLAIEWFTANAPDVRS